MSRVRTRARRVRQALLVTVLLVMSACTGIPDSTEPVVIGSAPSGVNSGTEGGLGIQPGGPVDGASIDEIVRGYINALTASDPELNVARQFLAPEVADSWTPEGAVTIISVGWSALPGGKSETVSFSGKRVANVDDDGIYQQASGQVNYSFELVEVDNQWRIQNPPDTLWIDETSFSALYQDVRVYFLDPTGVKVVPDLRYFRESGEQLANRLMRALIEGPGNGLAPAVRNELADPVTLESGLKLDSPQVTVNLSELGDKTEQQLKGLSAQVTWTLANASVNEVRITNDGEPISVPGVADNVQSTADWTSYHPDQLPVTTTAYYLNGGALFTADAQPVAGPPGTGEYAITDAAVSLEGTKIAAISAGTNPPVLRTGGINATLEVVEIPGSQSLASPTWGLSEDEFWLVRNGTELVRAGQKLSPTIVSAPSLADLGEITSIALSRDGTRLAIIAAKPAQPSKLYLAPVRREADTVSVGTAVVIGGSLDVSAVAWSDSVRLAVLGRSSPSADVQPYLLTIDDSVRQGLTQTNLQEGSTIGIAAAPGFDLIIAGNSTLLRYQNNTWVPIVGGQVVTGTKPVYPG